MAVIAIKGHSVLISDCDLEFVQSKSWYVREDKSGLLYAYNRGGQMSRQLMNCPAGREVDHHNGNTLDNRRDNLRICTHQQNQWNRKTALGKSKFKGVTHVKRHKTKPWMARVEFNGERHSYGNYRTALEAALAYDAAAVRLFGEFASPNFPERFRTKQSQVA